MIFNTSTKSDACRMEEENAASDSKHCAKIPEGYSKALAAYDRQKFMKSSCKMMKKNEKAYAALSDDKYSSTKNPI